MTKNDVLNKCDLDIWPTAMALKFWRQTEEILLTGQPQKVEEVIATSQGLCEVVLIRRPLFDAEGRINGVVGIAQDISEQKRTEAAIRESEELYRTFLRRSSEAILVMDAATRTVLEANEKLLTMTGYNLSEVIHTPVHRYVIDDPENVHRHLDEMKTNGGLAPELRYIRHKNGTRIPIERTAALIVHRGKQLILVTLRDLSQERKLQEQIQTDVQLAGKIQRALLPVDFANAWVEIGTVFEPHRLVSGDYFGYRWHEDSKILRGFILDVTGHGMGVVLQAASLNCMLNEMMMKDTLFGKETLVNLDREVSRYFPEESFAAVLVFELDGQKKSLTMGTGGISHFLASSQQYNGLADLPGSYVGIAPEPDFCFTTISVQDGDAFYFLSDGLYERLAENLPDDLSDYVATTTALRALARETKKWDDSSGIFLRIRQEWVWPLEFSFATRLEWQQIRRRLCRALNAASIESTRIEVAMNEAVNNALEHGGARCRITVRLRKNVLRLRVRSDNGFDGNGMLRCVSEAAPVTTAPLARAERGRGILLMAGLMDRVQYNARGTEVLLMKKLL